MIRLSYALKLASTKLRSRRGMLAASIVVASLLFAALIAMVIVFTGAEKSANNFIKKAGNDRYLVKVGPNIPYEKVTYLLTPSLKEIREIKTYEKQYYQNLKDKYKSLGLEYDASTESPALEPFAFADTSLPDEQRVRVVFSSPVIQELNDQKMQKYIETAKNKFTDLKRAGSKYGADGYYVVDGRTSLPVTPGMRLIKSGKEDFGSSDMKSGGADNYGYLTNAIYNGTYSFTDQQNLSRYILNTDTSKLKGVPVVVSAQEAAKLFGEKVGISKEPESVAEKKTWLSSVQAKLNGYVYQACYRNSTEQSMLEKIQRDYADIKNNEGDKNYKRPSLIYEYPNNTCGDITIKEDTRTATEKQAEARTVDTQKKLGTYVAPKHKLLTFQIVGFKYAQPYLDHTKGVSQFVRSLLVSQSDSSSIDIPIQMYDGLAKGLRFDDAAEPQVGIGTISGLAAGDDFATRVLEFSSAADARKFLDAEACPVHGTNCGKEFIGSPYGSNYLIIDEIGKLFSKIATIAFPSVLALAAIIIWFTISRIMAENRKETAVYRAMGARRRDIVGIYTVYIFLVALLVAAASSALGLAGAFAVDYFYGNTLTDTAVVAFGIVDDAPRFSLFSLDSPLLLIIIGSIFAISMVASIQPLVRNTMRSPIRDIRDE